MRTVGFFNPLVSRSRSRLVLNLGWVLADSGFRVVLVDLDPSATLTELAGALPRAKSSVFDALSARRGIALPALVEIDESLSIATSDPRLALVDAAVAPDPTAPPLGDAMGSLLAALADEVDADFVLCDLPAGYGHLVRAGIECSGLVWIPVSSSKLEAYAAEGLASWTKWAGGEAAIRDRFGWIEVHAGHDAGNARVARDRLHEALGGTVVGSLKEFPSLSAIASLTQKAEVALTTADGVSESQLAAVADLRRQHEVLATALLDATNALDDDDFREKLEEALYSVLSDQVPPALDTLSSATSIHSVADIELATYQVCRGGIRVAGAASVSADLHWGGRSDGVDSTMSFPMSFDLDLDRSHASANRVLRLDVDTTSFYE